MVAPGSLRWSFDKAQRALGDIIRRALVDGPQLIHHDTGDVVLLPLAESSAWPDPPVCRSASSCACLLSPTRKTNGAGTWSAPYLRTIRRRPRRLYTIL